MALSSYDLAISLNSDFVRAYTNRGMLQGKLGKSELALSDFDRVLALDSDRDSASAAALVGKGLVYMELGDYKIAQENLFEAKELLIDLGHTEFAKEVVELLRKLNQSQSKFS